MLFKYNFHFIEMFILSQLSTKKNAKSINENVLHIKFLFLFLCQLARKDNEQQEKNVKYSLLFFYVVV